MPGDVMPPDAMPRDETPGDTVPEDALPGAVGPAPGQTSTPSSGSLRQCGRCRLYFPAAGDLHPAELKEWWSCADCSTAIIPRTQREAAQRHPVSDTG